MDGKKNVFYIYLYIRIGIRMRLTYYSWNAKRILLNSGKSSTGKIPIDVPFLTGYCPFPIVGVLIVHRHFSQILGNLQFKEAALVRLC